MNWTSIGAWFLERLQKGQILVNYSRTLRGNESLEYIFHIHRELPTSLFSLLGTAINCQLNDGTIGDGPVRYISSWSVNRRGTYLQVERGIPLRIFALTGLCAVTLLTIDQDLYEESVCGEYVGKFARFG